MLPPAYDVEFLREHEGYVRSLARQLVFDEQLAQDIEQQTWLTALEHAPRDPRSPRAWLAQLVRNFAFRAWRGQARRAQREQAVARPEDSVTTPAEVLEREGVRRTLVEAVLALDEPYRTALILRFIDDLEPREIARRLHAPLATVRTRIQRGLELLRANLRRKHGDEYGAWSVALVHLLRLEPGSYRAIAAAAAKTLIQGALVMSVAQKFVIGAAAVAALAASLALWQQSRPAESHGSASLAAESAELTLPADSARQPSEAVGVGDRAEVAPSLGAQPSPPAPVESRYGSLLLHVVWGDDKTPAAGIHVRLFESAAEDQYRDMRFARTGDDGSVAIENLLPGNVGYEIDRSAHNSVQVERGERAEATIEVEPGFDVAGRVLDADAHPVADADVYLWGYGGDSHEGFVVARSGADGGYFVRSLPATMTAWLSARAPQRAPTQQRMLISRAGATLRIDLVFKLAGGALEGRVLAPDGAPIAGAQVLVGNPNDYADVRFDDGSQGRNAAAQRTFSDAQGRYRFDGVAEGAQPILARSKGFAPWRGEANVIGGSSTTRDIALVPGAKLTGVVRDEKGVPVVRSEIMAGDGYGFGSSYRRSAADGSFAMDDLPIGEFRVSVADDAGSAKTTLFGVSGATLHWDPVISKGLALRGRIDAPGRKVEDWWIAAKCATQPFWQNVSTDAEGRFEILNCPDAPLRLSVSAPGVYDWPVAVLDDVRPGPGEVTITPDPALEPSIRIHGRVLGPDGVPIGGAQIIPRNMRFPASPIVTSDLATGGFDLGPYPPGEWYLDVTNAGYPPIATPRRIVAAGEVVDLGDLQFVVGGSFVATLTRDAVVGAEVAWFMLTRPGSDWYDSLQTPGAELRSGPVAPGKYVLTLVPNGKFAPLARELEVRANEETRFELHLSAP